MPPAARRATSSLPPDRPVVYVSLGTVYKTLFRLEAKGLVAARVGEPTPARGGRRKKHYVVNARGRTALQRSLAALRGMSRGLDTALGLP